MSIGNGDSDAAGIPELVYDENNPFYVNSCSRHVEKHLRACDGNCERDALSENEIALVNEERAWLKAGMHPQGIGIDVIEMRIQLNVIMSLYTLDDWHELYVKARLDFFKTIRLENEDQVRQEQLQQKFHIPGKAPLLGPDGRPISP